jgi:hypothetical protein
MLSMKRCPLTRSNRLQASSYNDEKLVFLPVDPRLFFSPVGAGLPAILGMIKCPLTRTIRLQASAYKFTSSSLLEQQQSAPPIRGVTPGTHQQRHMVVGAGIGHAKVKADQV